MACYRGTWPHCLAWHGWLPALSPRRVHPSWGVTVVDCVDASLESAPGAYPLDPGGNWHPQWDPEDIADKADNVPANPNIWTDGSRDEDLDALMGGAGAGVYVRTVPCVIDSRTWGHAQDLDLADDACRIFVSVPGCLQTVLRGYPGPPGAYACSFGKDNKNVCNNVGRLLVDWTGAPFCLCNDGDLIAGLARMLQKTLRNTVRVSKVKGHATDAMVADGRVRKEDKEGNDAADIAADFGRLRQPEVIIDAKRNLLRV